MCSNLYRETKQSDPLQLNLNTMLKHIVISKVQENCQIGGLYQRTYDPKKGEAFGAYVHNHIKPGIGKIGALVYLKYDNLEA